MSITSKEYTDRNMLGFEGDIILKDKCQQIVESNSIKTIIETGTFMAGTTRIMAQWTDSVYTIEINKENYEKSKQNLTGYDNVNLIFGNSAEKLNEILAELAPLIELGREKMIKYKPVFFFLDAHFYDYNPLLAELSVISKYMVKPYLAIHDFKVPGHPELGFDSYKAQDYDFDWIKESVDKIYGKNGYVVEYNLEAVGAKRGAIFLTPKHG